MPSDEPLGATAKITDISPIARRISSRVIRTLIDPKRTRALRRIRELKRKLTAAPHRVHYFHQVEDPYSQLAVQALEALSERYAIENVCHIASPDTGPNQPEPELLAEHAHADCIAIAPHYGLEFPDTHANPSAEHIEAVQRALVAASREDTAGFAERAITLGRALWAGDDSELDSLCKRMPAASTHETSRALESARELRARWGHYSGAMFLYAGEWYWGVDRLYHLEQRLIELGVASGGEGVRFVRPDVIMDPVPDASKLTLEVFPSLRSPYTAISFDRTVELARRTGVTLRVRPVLPMVMRNVPVPFKKGTYIAFDTMREAQAAGVPFGRIVDPIGEPVRRAYSLWPWAHERGRGTELISSFLQAAWAEAVDTSREEGLRRVVERAELPWNGAREHLGDPAWEKELEENRLAMVGELKEWGVPSFRLSGPGSGAAFSTWGQDRLWLIASEIQRRGGVRQG